MTERPKVGIGVVIRKESKVLIGERIGSTYANNTWHLAGGLWSMAKTLPLVPSVKPPRNVD